MHRLKEGGPIYSIEVGRLTVSKSWESGRNVQTAAMDILLRLIRDIPGSIEYLRDLAA